MARMLPRTLPRTLPVVLTLIAVAIAAVLSWAMWQAYMAAPWTRDGTVLAYVVTMAPEVSGRIVALPVADNQLVRKGDPIMTIDPTNYALAVARAQGAADQARLAAENAEREARRRAALPDTVESQEDRQTFATTAATDEAAYQQASAALAQAQVDLQRTRIISPVNGYVTNLRAQQGDYATAGQSAVSIVDTDSFWVAGYFEETLLADIHEGDPATVKLMAYDTPLHGHVESVSRGIAVANMQPSAAGLATVNPIFTWVRLAQRVPVRIHIDQVPPGVRLVVGETASVQIDRN